MWISISVAIALVLLAVVGYLLASQREKPIEDDNRYMMVYEDGLFELFFGLLLIAAGILLNYYAGMVGVLFALLYPFVLSAKALITKPRLDPSELPNDVVKRRQLSMFVVLGLFLLAGMLFVVLLEVQLPVLRGWLDRYLVMALAVVLAGLLTLMAYRTGAQRLYLYAAFVLAAYLSSFWLAFAFPLYLIAIGMGVMVVGLTVTMRFIQEHPKLVASG